MSHKLQGESINILLALAIVAFKLYSDNLAHVELTFLEAYSGITWCSITAAEAYTEHFVDHLLWNLIENLWSWPLYVEMTFASETGYSFLLVCPVLRVGWSDLSSQQILNAKLG